MPVTTPWRSLPGLALAATLIACGSAGEHRSDVSVRFSTSDPDAAPFPSDRYTVADARQLTQLRVALPKPDCAVRVSDCHDTDELNTLDGFSLIPRFTVPFTGDIDPATANSDSVYLLELASGRRIAINQIAWDAPARLLSFKSDELLREQQRYLMVVTDRVRDTAGKRLGAGDWHEGSSGLAIGSAAESGTYREALRQALALAPADAGKPVAATLFTTQTATATLAAMAGAVKARTGSGVDFMVATQAGVSTRAVFGVDRIASGVFHRQTGTAPQFTDTALRLSALQAVPGSVAQVGFGRFASPTFLDDRVRITPNGTAAVPLLLGERQVAVQIFVPAGPRPAAGWPVVLFGHGLGNNMHDAPWNVASVLASHGLATASIHVVGHGGGAQSTLELALAGGGQASVAMAGRGVDMNGDGVITAFEGATSPAPYGVLGSRDALRQTVTDLMELARRFKAGVDIDGDGQADVDGNRVSYSGQSFGGVYGTMLLAVDKDLAAGVPNVGGGSLIEATRLGSLRALRVASLAGRAPPLVNLPPTATGAAQFDENLPFRGQPVLTRHVDGAQAIAKLFDHSEWAQQSGEATAYAPLIRLRPLAGHAPKPIIYQLVKGDTVMTNTSSGMVVRGGALADRVSWFRHDLAFAAHPAVARNPHGYLLDIGNPAARPHAVAAQHQIGAFLASGGTSFTDADGAQPFFENGIDVDALDRLNILP